MNGMHSSFEYKRDQIVTDTDGKDWIIWSRFTDFDNGYDSYYLRHKNYRDGTCHDDYKVERALNVEHFYTLKEVI